MPKKDGVPKKVAGMKMPKALRKSGLVKSFLASPAGRQILAEAVMAAATAAAAVIAGSKSAAVNRATEEAQNKAGELVKEVVGTAAGALTGALGAAAQSILPTSSSRGGGRKSAGRGRKQAAPRKARSDAKAAPSRRRPTKAQ